MNEPKGSGDRQTLAERMIEIRESLSRIEDFCIAPSSRVAFTHYRDEILKHISDLTRAEGQDGL